MPAVYANIAVDIFSNVVRITLQIFLIFLKTITETSVKNDLVVFESISYIYNNAFFVSLQKKINTMLVDYWCISM